MTHVLTQAEEERYRQLQELALEAARSGYSDTLGAMLDHGLPVNLCDHKGQTLLMLASYHGHAAATRILLEHGADPDRPNDRGQSPLAGAAFKGHDPVVALLLEYGADSEADNGAGMTPLMFATLFGRFEVAKRLAAHKTTVRRRTRFALFTPYLRRVLRLLSLLTAPRSLPSQPATSHVV